MTVEEMDRVIRAYDGIRVLEAPGRDELSQNAERDELSQNAEHDLFYLYDPAADLPYDFRPGTPDWHAFPRTVWWRLLGLELRHGDRRQH